MNHPACKHLRNKRMYVPSLAVDVFAQEKDCDPVCHYWCNKTMAEVGLDDQHVSDVDCCDPRRPCYRAD